MRISQITNRIRAKALTLFLRVYGYAVRDRRISSGERLEELKVNLGAGLKVAPSWLNIDFNLPSLFARRRPFHLRRLYRLLKAIHYSELDRPQRFCLSEDDFVHLLTSNRFLCHDLRHGIPLEDATVDCFYSSHLLGYSFSKETSKSLLQEIYRTLRPGGMVRLSLVDGDHYWSHRNPEQPYTPDDNCFRRAEICGMLAKTGFVDIEMSQYRSGNFPDIETLDDYSPEVDRHNVSKTLYVQCVKPFAVTAASQTERKSTMMKVMP